MAQEAASETHVLAVLKLDNGELVEDVIEVESEPQKMLGDVIHSFPLSESMVAAAKDDRSPGRLPRD